MAVTATIQKLGFILSATDKMIRVIGNAEKNSAKHLDGFEKSGQTSVRDY